MEKSQGGTQVTFEWSERLFSSDTDHSFVELLQTYEHGRVLLMDGEVQFAESDEHRYHEMLVHPVLMLAGHSPRVLILGGGDGLAAREVLKWYPERVDIVDYDETFVRKLGMDLLRDLNKDSFFDPSVVYHCRDARDFLKTRSLEYDVVLVDLPDPDGDEMEKLYRDVLSSCVGALKHGGVLSVHIGGLILQKDNPCWEFVRQTNQMLETLFVGSKTCLRTAAIPSFFNVWGFFYVIPQNIQVTCAIPENQTRYWDVENEQHVLFMRYGRSIDKDIRAFL